MRRVALDFFLIVLVGCMQLPVQAHLGPSLGVIPKRRIRSNAIINDAWRCRDSGLEEMSMVGCLMVVLSQLDIILGKKCCCRSYFFYLLSMRFVRLFKFPFCFFYVMAM